MAHQCIKIIKSDIKFRNSRGTITKPQRSNASLFQRIGGGRSKNSRPARVRTQRPFRHSPIFFLLKSFFSYIYLGQTSRKTNASPHARPGPYSSFVVSSGFGDGAAQRRAYGAAISIAAAVSISTAFAFAVAGYRSERQRWGSGIE